MNFFRLAQHSSVNSMDESNLGRCFGPTLLRFEGSNRDLMADLHHQALVGQ